MSDQLSLFDFEELHPPKKETEIKPFFLVTYGLCYDRLKYGTSKENSNMLTRHFDTIEEVRNFLYGIVGKETAENYIQKAIENIDEWEIYKDNSMYIF